MAKRRVIGVPPSVQIYALRLSPRAQGILGKWEWEVDDDLRVSHDEFRRLLALKHFPEWPFLWPLEQAFGGTEWAQIEFGIADMLSDHDAQDMVDEATGEVFVPAGYNDQLNLCFGRDGGLYTNTSPTTMRRLDASYEGFLEDLAMQMEVNDWLQTGRVLQADLRPRQAAELLSSRRSIPPVPEATNDCHHWWQSDTITVNDDSGEGSAVVRTRSLNELVSAILRVATEVPDLEVRPFARSLETDGEQRVTSRAELTAQAPAPEALAARPCARRFPLGQPAYGFSTREYQEGEVWITGSGDDLRVDVLERSFGKLTSWWTIGQTDSRCLRAYPAGP
jgi:hypothetical protein